MNFKNFGNGDAASITGGSTGQPQEIFPLARQSSVFSLTFDEFQRGGSIGKDFGSMNIDELMKNIWAVEGAQQNVGPTGGPEGISGNPSIYLQTQGSITLPPTLSQKTVEEVWRDLNLPTREVTLGEVTLEEFLASAGVIKEETRLSENSQNFDFLGDLNRPITNSSPRFEFQQMDDCVFQNNNRPSVQQHQRILPKLTALAYANTDQAADSTRIGYSVIKRGVVGIGNQTDNMDNLVQNGGMGMIGMGNNGVNIVDNSVSVDTSSVSPVPCVFTGGLRGRRGNNNGVEKVIERRQRRMIKNRESAARSRARKQAYTMELEAEIANLKEEYQELQKKQERIMEMQKDKILELKTTQQGGKTNCLKRTHTGPW